MGWLEWIKDFVFDIQSLRTLVFALITVLATDFVKKWFKQRGLIRANVSGWHLGFLTRNDWNEQVPTNLSVDAYCASYRFNVEFLSEKELNTGLHAFQVHFMQGGKVVLTQAPGECLGGGEFRQVPEPVDLPCRKWSERKHFGGDIERKHLPQLLSCDQAILEAKTPDGKTQTWQLAAIVKPDRF
jgi:hypothetical protein